MQSAKTSQANQRISGALLNYVYLAITVVSSLIYVPILLKTIGASQYGLYQTIGSIISYLSILDAGLSTTLTRYYSYALHEDNSDKKKNLIGMSVVMYAVQTVLAVVIGIVLLEFLPDIFGATFTQQELVDARLMMLVVIADIAVVLPGNLFTAIINAEERFSYLQIINICKALAQPVFVIFVVYNLYPYALGVVVVQWLVNVAVIAMNAVYCIKKIGISISFKKFDHAVVFEMIKFSFAALLSLIFDQIFWRSDQIIIAACSGTADVALYSIASTVVNAYIQFSNGISFVFLPKLTKLVAAGNNGDVDSESVNKEMNSLFIKVGRIQFCIVSFIFTAFVVFGKQFIVLWAGPEYLNAYYVVIIFMIAMFMPLIQNIAVPILQAKNLQMFKSIVYIIIALINLCVSIPATQAYSYWGASVTSMICLMIGTIPIINWYYKTKVNLDVGLFFRRVFKLAAPVCFCTLLGVVIAHFVLAILNWGLFVLAAILYTVLYGTIIWLAGLTGEERGEVLSLLTRKGSV